MTPPYAVEREIEDIEALVDRAGGSAFLSGISSGAALAMGAAIALDGIAPGSPPARCFAGPPANNGAQGMIADTDR